MERHAVMTSHAKKIAENLTSAIIASSYAPVLLLDGALSVISASNSFCKTFNITLKESIGQPLSAIGRGEWNIPKLLTFLKLISTEKLDIYSYNIFITLPDNTIQNLSVHAHKLDYGDLKNVRLLVAILDVTKEHADEKQKQALILEKNLLFQELQHRVANSLQIIASILMQSARQLQSAEMRAHLHDAHQRVISIASLQKKLALADANEVPLRDYFTDLCQSISHSMIKDSEQISLTVEADGSIASADVSTSLGLIITELVINALKHAFPDNRCGRILVKYHSHGEVWSLSVVDNGIGMPDKGEEHLPGLGTNIITALVKHLGARLTVANACPGVRITIDHA